MNATDKKQFKPNDQVNQLGISELKTIYNRFKSLGIELEFAFNFPFVYLKKINDKNVKEKFVANHGFLVGYTPFKKGGEFKVYNIKEFLKIIRKYTGRKKE